MRISSDAQPVIAIRGEIGLADRERAISDLDKAVVVVGHAACSRSAGCSSALRWRPRSHSSNRASIARRVSAETERSRSRAISRSRS